MPGRRGTGGEQHQRPSFPPRRCTNIRVHGWGVYSVVGEGGMIGGGVVLTLCNTGGYSFVACLSHLTIDHAFLSRRRGYHRGVSSRYNGLIPRSCTINCVFVRGVWVCVRAPRHLWCQQRRHRRRGSMYVEKRKKKNTFPLCFGGARMPKISRAVIAW